MFEQPAGKVEKDRSRMIMVLSAVAVLGVIVLVILVSSGGDSGPSEVLVSRPGSAEFDSYAQSVKISDVEMRTGERATGSYGRVMCTVQNSGDRVLVGLQLRGVAIDFNSQVLKEKIITPVPNQKETLGPNQGMEIDLYLDPIKDRSQIMDMKIELYGLKLQ
jgi:hypothetical protein